VQTIDLLVCPRYLVPVEPAAAVLEGVAMAVDGDRILSILPCAEAETRYAPRERLELPQHVVLPGLVNAHTHAAMSLMRGLADDLPLMDWLSQHIWPTEGAHVSPAFCADGVDLAMAEMIKSGTTCFNDMYFFPDVTAERVRRAGMAAVLGLIVIDFPTAWARDADEYIHKGREVHDALHGDPRLRTIFAPHAPYTVSDAPLRKLRIFATELGIGVHMHVHETAGEVAMAVEAGGPRPWQRLRALDMLGPDFLAVHMTQLSAAEIAEAGEHRISVAHCPESNLKLASGFCPVAALLKAGVNIALGTDGAASNNDLDLLGEMRTAALLAKAVAQDAAAFGAPQALHAATLGGARALGLEAEIGSLAPGKRADFIAIDLGQLPTQPLYNVLSQIVYASGREQVTHSFVAGRALMRDRILTSLDEAAILSRAAEWRERIRPRARAD
jgi:5-methylthioadenosine/S-adenosylhomocysteine deaminase